MLTGAFNKIDWNKQSHPSWSATGLLQWVEAGNSGQLVTADLASIYWLLNLAIIQAYPCAFLEVQKSVQAPSSSLILQKKVK